MQTSFMYSYMWVHTYIAIGFDHISSFDHSILLISQSGHEEDFSLFIMKLLRLFLGIPTYKKLKLQEAHKNIQIYEICENFVQ